MAAEFTKTDVERVAELARLRLTDEETTTFAAQLADILGYADQVRSLDTAGVVATAHVLDQEPTDRADQVHPSLPLPDVLANAPEAADGLFKVPRVIGA
jgi:aspartyl-tRNA(Asn)/glutamyl-tRNA(Gln) amidotransferase subunit C